MVSLSLSSDVLLKHPLSYLGFSYLGHGVSLHSCSSKAQCLLLTLDVGYLLMTAFPDLEHGVAPLGPPLPMQPALCPLLGIPRWWASLVAQRLRRLPGMQETWI